jgi:cystathionine beta-lyase
MSFDKQINRKNTNCIKYDSLESRFGLSKDEITPLWIADMDFETPWFIANAIVKKAEESLFGYPLINDDIYESIIWWQKNRHNFEVEKEEISLVPSVLSAMSCAIETFSNKGDSIIIQPPIYPPFKSIVKNNDRELILNPLKKVENDFEIYFDDLEKKIKPNTKFLLLCSPHNPVGKVWSQEELKKLGEICLKHNILIITDEIHSDITFQKFTPLATISKDIANITITLNAPTKTFNLAGLKIAYTITKNKNLNEKLNKTIKSKFIDEINTFAPIAMQQAYTPNGAKWVDELNAYLQNNITLVEQKLKTTKIKLIKPQATYLLWLDFSSYKHLTHKQISQKLQNEAKLLLNDGITFGKDEGKYHFRMNVALPRQSLELALNKLAGIFD